MAYFSPLSLATGQSERALELKELENNLGHQLRGNKSYSQASPYMA